MNPILHNLPIVKSSDVQKNFKRVVADVKKNGYRFVVNRGNTDIVLVSLPLFQKKIAESEKKEQDGKELFADWKGKKTTTILKELRKKDTNKKMNVYLKELIQWQDEFLS